MATRNRVRTVLSRPRSRVLPGGIRSNEALPEINKAFPEIFGTSSNVSEAVPDINGVLPEINGTFPDASETAPEISEWLPEINGTFPDASEPLPSVNEPLPDTTGSLPDGNHALPDIKDRFPDIRDALPNISAAFTEINACPIDLRHNITACGKGINSAPAHSTLRDAVWHPATQKMPRVANPHGARRLRRGQDYPRAPTDKRHRGPAYSVR